MFFLACFSFNVLVFHCFIPGVYCGVQCFSWLAVWSPDSFDVFFFL